MTSVTHLDYLSLVLSCWWLSVIRIMYDVISGRRYCRQRDGDLGEVVDREDHHPERQVKWHSGGGETAHQWSAGVSPGRSAESDVRRTTTGRRSYVERLRHRAGVCVTVDSPATTTGHDHCIDTCHNQWDNHHSRHNMSIVTVCDK